MQVHSTSTEDFTRVLDLLGLHFQIRDDYANLKSEVYAENKSFAEDLTEGEWTRARARTRARTHRRAPC